MGKTAGMENIVYATSRNVYRINRIKRPGALHSVKGEVINFHLYETATAKYC